MPDENVQMYAGGAQRRNPDVIYYRNKKGWITWGDTQASKQLDMIRKGCTPLPKYGNITYSEDLWGPILRHPDGPAEFPLEQVLTYRWYNPKRLPDLRRIETISQGKTSEYVRVGEQPKIKFPQLKGVSITEYPCPENCSRGGEDLNYHNPLHLGTHLRVAHEYDRSEILKYGAEMGIDFSKVPGGKQLVSFDFDDDVDETVAEVEADAEFTIAVVDAQHPATEEIKAEVEVRLDCADCGWVNEKNTSQGLDIHKKRWCKAQAVPA